MNKNAICPRCKSYVPNNERPGEYPGALSRSRPEEICSACGTEEALLQYAGINLEEEEWPLLYLVVQRHHSLSDGEPLTPAVSADVNTTPTAED